MGREYAFLMINYDTPEIIKDIHNLLTDDEIYTEEGKEYGIEHETHVTLVPCLDNDVDLEELKKYLKDISEYDAILTDISKFECEDYDVLKCAAKSKTLYDTNKKIVKIFDTHSEYKEYQPHLTIAYMKHGMADKYLKKILPKLVQLKPKGFHFSYVNENGDEKDIKFEK